MWADFKSNILRSSNSLNHLLALNIIVFVLMELIFVISAMFLTGQEWYENFTHYLSFPSSFVEILYRPWSIITYQFVHSGFWHLFLNMLTLFFAGRIFREFLGDKKLVSVYILGGVAGAILYSIAYNVIPAYSSLSDLSVVIGASGSIMAVLAATGALLPNYTVMLILIGPVKLIYVVAALVLFNILSLAGPNAGGMVTHIGGVIFGFAYIRLLQSGNDIGAWLTNFLGYLKSFSFSTRSKPKLSYYNPEPLRTTKSKNPSGEKTTQEQIDIILDKIARSGYDSLSQKEKDILFKASKED